MGQCNLCKDKGKVIASSFGGLVKETVTCPECLGKHPKKECKVWNRRGPVKEVEAPEIKPFNTSVLSECIEGLEIQITTDYNKGYNEGYKQGLDDAIKTLEKLRDK